MTKFATRILLAILACMLAHAAAADKNAREEFPAPAGQQSHLTIWATIDIDAARPLIVEFQRQRPHIAVTYREMETRTLFEESLLDASQGPDLTISSAMDLQVKLVNDGHAHPYSSEATARLLPWANWRNEAFAVTQEPAVIVYNSDFAKSSGMPRTRDAFVDMLARRAGELRGKVATYDISESGIGYLYASHDALRSANFGALIRGLGETAARLYCCTSDALAAIERGEVLVGYNLLGSYAAAKRRRGAKIEIVMPEDFTLVMARVAVIPRKAGRPDLAGQFIDFLLSAEGQAALVEQGLSDGSGRLESVDGEAKHLEVTVANIQPIAVSPALLVFLDRIKHERFIRNWRDLMHRPTRF